MESKKTQHILRQTVSLLRYTFALVPIAAGADKFTNLLTHWEKYINPTLSGILPLPGAGFMMIAGVIEIIAGIIVLKKPELGGYIVAAWLTVVALSLLPGLTYADVAVRDLVMAIAAFSMARLSILTEA